MVISDEFRKFLGKYKCERGKPCTHTSIDQPKARLNIPDDKLDEFYKLYSHAQLSSVPLHFTEKPTEISPLRVDLDFRFIKTGDQIIRHYTQSNIEKILEAYFEILHKYIDDGSESLFDAYVMEKENPSEYRGKIKDGLHFIFPNIKCTTAFQHLVRRQILDKAALIFADLQLYNSFENVIDEAIIEHNNWQIYGSRKPDCESYRVTSVYRPINDGSMNMKIQELDKLSAHDELNLVSKLSMRLTGPNAEQTDYKDDKVAEIDEYTRFVLPTFDNRKKTTLNSRIFGKSVNPMNNYICEDDKRLAKQLVLECLKPERAERYEERIKVGWCLRNIDCSLLETFTEFSQMSSKYVEGECQQLWNKMQVGTLGIGSLLWWANQDNPVRFNDLLNNNVNALVDKCIGSDGAHFDIAKVVHAMFKNKYLYASNDTWYLYDKNKHRWLRTREGVRLRTILSCEVCEKVLERAKYWNRQGANSDNEEERKTCDDKHNKLLKIAKQLKMSGYKDSIMKECKSLFTDEKCEEKFNSNPSLIGFDNGVYDLQLHEFRDGEPEDFITYSTNQCYIPFNPNGQAALEIEEFFSQVFVNINVRKFVKDVFAAIVDGSIRHEKFYVFTGSGSNGKSKLIELLQRSIGDYYCILPIALLTQKRASSNSAQSEVARTIGRRIAVMQEPGNDETMNIGYMKELTGGDRIQCRALYKEPFEFTPQFKMILTCNDLPDVPSNDGGTWRRICVVEFQSKFTEKPAATNEFLIDTAIVEKFEGWAPTFLSMLIAHHNERDLKTIHEPSEVRIATQGYKNNNDVIGQFVTERVVKVDDKATKTMLNSLYSEFRAWATKFLPKGKRLPERPQVKAYMEKLFGPYPTSGWKGLQVKPKDDTGEPIETVEPIDTGAGNTTGDTTDNTTAVTGNVVTEIVADVTLSQITSRLPKPSKSAKLEPVAETKKEKVVKVKNNKDQDKPEKMIN